MFNKLRLPNWSVEDSNEFELLTCEYRNEIFERFGKGYTNNIPTIENIVATYINMIIGKTCNETS